VVIISRIGILTCSNATQDLGCSSVSCLNDLRKRKGAFKRYEEEDALDLVGIISCSGCPTLAGPDKLLKRIKALTEFRIDAIHFSYCVDALCPFKGKFESLIKEQFPEVEVVIGTHEIPITDEQFRGLVKSLFNQQEYTMIDVIKGRQIKSS
jgi:predicted metal-binding protein